MDGSGSGGADSWQGGSCFPAIVGIWVWKGFNESRDGIGGGRADLPQGEGSIQASIGIWVTQGFNESGNSRWADRRQS